MIDIHEVMATLSIERPVFHSEADFQHAFAWEIHRRLPNASVRLERPLPVGSKVLHLDFLVVQGEAAIAIELKYKTRTLSVQIDSEKFRLANHSAQDCGRYDYINDICRLEQITLNLPNTTGFAILLTNDSAYWTPATNGKTVDAAFRLTEARMLQGSLGWTDEASEGTKRSREDILALTGQYHVCWRDYTTAIGEAYGKFRYLATRVQGA